MYFTSGEHKILTEACNQVVRSEFGHSRGPGSRENINQHTI